MREIKYRAYDKEYGHVYANAYPFEHLVYIEMPQDEPEVQARRALLRGAGMSAKGIWQGLERRIIDRMNDTTKALGEWIGDDRDYASVLLDRFSVGSLQEVANALTAAFGYGLADSIDAAVVSDDGETPRAVYPE